MTDESAAGRKTDPIDEKPLQTRLMDGLEEHFHGCTQVLRGCRETVFKRGGYTEGDLRTTLQFTRTSAQLASMIARIAMLKSSGSIPK